MVRKMAYIGTMFFIGLFCASFFNAKNNIIIGLGLIAIGILFAIIINHKNLTVSVCILSFGIALLDYGIYQNFLYNPLIALNGQNISVSGKVTEINYSGNDKSFYTIKGKINGKYNSSIILYFNDVDCEYNDCIDVEGTAETLDNSYLFPTKSYYNAKGIYLAVYDGDVSITANNNFSIVKPIMKYRDYLYNIINKYLTSDEGKMFSAMLFGDKSGLDSDIKTLMFRSGIGHIMAVSGTHLAVFAYILSYLIKIFVKNKWISFIAVETSIIAFTIFAGLSVSVIRSAIMITLVLAAGLFDRKADVYNSLGISVLIMSFFSPYVIRDASFVLSVTGVFGMGVVAPYFTNNLKFNFKFGNFVKKILFMVCAVIPIIPVSAIFFDEVSLISPLTNVFLIPVCFVVLICGILMSITGGIEILAVPLLIVSGLCCKIVLIACKFIGKLRLSYINVSDSFTLICMFSSGVILILCYLIFKSKKQVIISLILLIICFSVTNLSLSIIDNTKIHISVLGEKSATAIIVRQGSNTAVLCVENTSKSLDYIKKYLTQNGISNINILLIDDNVPSGLAAYQDKLKLIKVNNVLVPLNTYILPNTTFLNNSPQIIDSDDCLIDMNNFKIKCNDGNYFILTDNLSVLVGDGAQYNNQDVYIQYEGKEQTFNSYLWNFNLDNQDKFCGYEIIIDNNDFDVKGIKNASRQ